MTKRHHSCPFCEAVLEHDCALPKDRIDWGAFHKGMRGKVEPKDQRVPMRSGAELEQQARQRVADFKRLLYLRRDSCTAP